MEEDVWVALDRDEERYLWKEFAARYEFEGYRYRDPTPSVVWDLTDIDDGRYPGGYEAGVGDVAALVLGTLQDCTQWWESVVYHDWLHRSLRFRPHKVDVPEEVPRWDVRGLFPKDDYTIFIGRDYAFGIVGSDWDRSLCVFGEPAIAAFTTRNEGILTTVLRRDGRPVSAV